ncbi:hypothetical protein [Nocardioides campestrisoli]|uniref:hypothetical protein n=1 Tax=Nocardioides campestrisoli TaxID=2736757 RepID=UPI0015E71BF2|nr:hypothetical protein [Nocardioides campestrisoli]
MAAHPATQTVLLQIQAERVTQNQRYGAQHHEDGTGYGYLRRNAEKAARECDSHRAAGRLSWRLLLRKQYRQALAEDDLLQLRRQLIRVAATACAWVEDIDSRLAGTQPTDTTSTQEPA